MKKISVGKVILTVLKIMVAALILCLCLGMTAVAKNHLEREEKQSFYLEQKQVLLGEVRGYLKEQGYRNSGVMMTRRTDGQAAEEWVISVSHGDLKHLSEEEKLELQEELAGLAKAYQGDAFLRVIIK